MTANRETDAPIQSQFTERWSPRAFAAKPVSNEQLASLFEAARWAPSSSNEQPWMFLYANTEETLAYFRPLLVDANRRWADKAPVLMFVFARKAFAKNQKPNATANFDTGSAWMSLALQAHSMGLITHGMAGIHHERIYQELNVPKSDYEVLCAVALGYPGDATQLPEDLQAREIPSTRKPVSEFAICGRLK